MSVECKEITVEVFHIDMDMRSALCAIDKDRYVMLVCAADNLFDRVYSAEDIADMRHADELSALIEHGIESIEVEYAFVRHRNNAETNAFLESLQLPRHDIGMVLHSGDNDLVAFLKERIREGTCY